MEQGGNSKAKSFLKSQGETDFGDYKGKVSEAYKKLLNSKVEERMEEAQNSKKTENFEKNQKSEKKESTSTPLSAKQEIID